MLDAKALPSTRRRNRLLRLSERLGEITSENVTPTLDRDILDAYAPRLAGLSPAQSCQDARTLVSYRLNGAYTRHEWQIDVDHAGDQVTATITVGNIRGDSEPVTATAATEALAIVRAVLHREALV